MRLGEVVVVVEGVWENGVWMGYDIVWAPQYGYHSMGSCRAKTPYETRRCLIDVGKRS